jgi:hypothetical protein
VEGVIFARLRLRRTFTACRDLADREAAVRDTTLIIGSDRPLDLHAGRKTVPEPGPVRGFGRARLLVVDGRHGPTALE